MQKRELAGLILLILGGLFLTFNIGFPHYTFWRIISLVWPLALIGIGVYLLFRKRFPSGENTWAFSEAADKAASEFERKVEQAFGDVTLDTKGAEIDGMNVSCVFGDSRVNLTGAKLKQGINQMSISTTFGDAVVVVPSGVEVWAFGTSTMGDVEIFDRRVSGISNSLSHQTTGYDTASVKVQITARTTFGDVRVFWG
jgi:predicted membrane protein